MPGNVLIASIETNPQATVLANYAALINPLTGGAPTAASTFCAYLFDLPVLYDVCSVGYTTTGAAPALEIYAYIGGAWRLRDGWTAPAALQAYERSLALAPRPMALALVGANVNAVSWFLQNR